MNCFQLIKTVLDEAYESIPGSESEKDEAIKEAAQSLRKKYANLHEKNDIDYTKPAYRFAYIYTYTTSHANMVFQIIEQNDSLESLFDKDKISVSCIGGGPGSDFLGILKYCLNYEKKPFLKCHIIDGDPQWNESWNDVDEKLLVTDQRISTNFFPFDVTNDDDIKRYKKHHQSNLFTFIYFLSELYSKKDKATFYFENLFDNMKQGSIVLFVDNNAECFYDWFDEMTNSSFNSLYSKEKSMNMPLNEEKTDLESYFSKFGSPKLKGNVAIRILQKK